MKTDEIKEENTPTDHRPLGFWLRVVDGLLTREFTKSFESDGVDRRDWMLLNAIAGEVENPWISARLERGGARVRALAERGWIEPTEGGWALTDEGHAAKEHPGADVDGIRSRVAGAVSPEDYATMTASLEAIARELGWDESSTGFQPRGFRRRGFGPGHGFAPRHGFGHGRHGFGEGRGVRPEFGPGMQDGPCHPHSRGHGGRHGERAYERGFDAGFARGREAGAYDPSA